VIERDIERERLRYQYRWLKGALKGAHQSNLEMQLLDDTRQQQRELGVVDAIDELDRSLEPTR